MAIAVTTTYGNTWNSTTTPQTESVTVANGDMLVILAAARSNGITFGTLSGGGLTYTAQTSISANANCPSTAIFTAPSASAQTFTFSIARTAGTLGWGHIVLRLTGVLAVGAKTSVQDAVAGTEQTTLTTTAANSAIAIILNDRDSGTAPTWVTSSAGTATNEGTINTTQSNYPGIYLDAGAIGVKTIGVSSPTGFASTISAIELTPTLPAVNSRPLLLVRQAAKRATFW